MPSDATTTTTFAAVVVVALALCHCYSLLLLASTSTSSTLNSWLQTTSYDLLATRYELQLVFECPREGRAMPTPLHHVGVYNQT